MICNICKQDKQRYRVTENSLKPKFIDEVGKSWCGLRCPACWSKMQHTRYERSRVGLELDKRHVLARTAEEYAASYFTRSGYEVVTANGRSGPDLIIKKDGTEFTCEVKKLTVSGKNHRCFSVIGDRVNDDFIFLVFPDMKNFIFMPMSEWMSSYQIYKKQGVTVYTPGIIPKNRLFTIYESNLIKKDYFNGLNPNKLAKKYGVNVRSIYRAINYGKKRLENYDKAQYTQYPSSINELDPEKKCEWQEPEK